MTQQRTALNKSSNRGSLLHFFSIDNNYLEFKFRCHIENKLQLITAFKVNITINKIINRPCKLLSSKSPHDVHAEIKYSHQQRAHIQSHLFSSIKDAATPPLPAPPRTNNMSTNYLCTSHTHTKWTWWSHHDKNPRITYRIATSIQLYAFVASDENRTAMANHLQEVAIFRIKNTRMHTHAYVNKHNKLFEYDIARFRVGKLASRIPWKSWPFGGWFGKGLIAWCAFARRCRRALYGRSARRIRIHGLTAVEKSSAQPIRRHESIEGYGG